MADNNRIVRRLLGLYCSSTARAQYNHRPTDVMLV